MRKSMLVIAFLIAILIVTSGCSKESTLQHEEKQIDSQLIGIWRHQEVPSLPHYSTWLIIINKDGTYRTKSDTYDTADSGTSSHTEAFGPEGTYVLAGNKIMFRSSGTGISRTEIYEITDQNGQKQLVFKDSNGKNKSSVGVGGINYDLMFINEN